MAKLAKGQVGLIISSHAYVNPTGQADIRQLGIYDDRLIANYKKMVEKVHNEGSKIIIQINHAGAKTPVNLIKNRPLGPSSMEIKDKHCKTMTVS